MPHVIEWWGEPSIEPELDKLDDARIAMWIVEHRGRPFAFAQDYDVHGWDPHPFSYLPPGARGIDQYIGEPDLLGKGHGSAFVRLHVERLFREGAPAVGTDPHPSNLRARRAYARGERAMAGTMHVAGISWPSSRGVGRRRDETRARCSRRGRCFAQRLGQR
jgi:aminoglycoside 6'-N-acetyltransferase